MTNHLGVLVGFHTAKGLRPRNEDFGSYYLGTDEQRIRQGVTLAMADGVGGAKGGRVAAELTVRSFIEAYYGQSETIGIGRATAIAIESINRWVLTQGRSDASLTGMACTLTGLILRGRKAHIVHVGDTRLYRMRAGNLNQLTKDHVLDNPDMKHVLLRAIGTEEGVRVDYVADTVRVHDRFLICSDGIHGALRDPAIRDILLKAGTPEKAAQDLVEAALSAGSSDNATALIADVTSLPATEHAELQEAAAALPIPDVPSRGDIIDGFELVTSISAGRYSQLFRAIDTVQNREVVVKFPKPRVAEDASLRLATIRETWVSSRVRSPWVGEVFELAPGRQTRLYSVMPYYDGETLEQRLTRRPRVSLSEGIGVAIKLTKAIAALHRARIIHRDIKPENVILQPDNDLKIVDLGVAYLANVDDFPSVDTPGTPSYMAPELFSGQYNSERSDLFALGVTVYRMFSGGSYPYGEIEPFSQPRFGKPKSLLHHRPDLPHWLDLTIMKAIAVEPSERFFDALEFAFEVENGFLHSPKITPARRSLHERNPIKFWQIISLLLLVLLLASLATR